MRRRKEYIWKEKQNCPVCGIRITEGRRMDRHIRTRHREDKLKEHRQKETDEFMRKLKSLKDMGVLK
jgi:hypothetical protein